ncbi:MAG TPA: RNA polymerase sigma factor [Ktedonobacteraceae bacterium]|nr:RNA polymerase sigma factor [Ktedonobacteraceae bacterium]
MQHSTGLPVSDESAFAEFYQRHVIPLLNFIRRYIPTREDAEDILVDVFFAAYEQRIPVVLHEDEQFAWLRQVAYHKCVDLLRRQQRRPTVTLENVAERLYEADERSPEQVALRTDDQSLLHACLAELSAQQQVVVHLKFGQRLSGVEIARRLNKSESSVSMLLARALNHLREMYGLEERRSRQ